MAEDGYAGAYGRDGRVAEGVRDVVGEGVFNCGFGCEGPGSRLWRCDMAEKWESAAGSSMAGLGVARPGRLL